MPLHQMSLRPRFGELDPYNHVNHSVYVAWFEAGRCEALESIDLALHSLADQGLQIVVTDLRVHYGTPARAGDDLIVETAVTEIGGVTSTWSQRLIRVGATSPGGHQAPVDALAAPPRPGPEVLCHSEVRAGACDLAGRPTRAGARLKSQLLPLFVAPDAWRELIR